MSASKTFIQNQVEGITRIWQDYTWMTRKGLPIERAINFGCEIPGQTLALMWASGAREIAGLARTDETAVHEEDNMMRLQNELQGAWDDMVVGQGGYEDADRAAWNDTIPDFFKNNVIRADHSIDYAIADFTKFVPLPEAYYDLAFCDFVLHKLMWDQTLEDAEMTTRFVIGQMSRSVRPGGFVSCYEMARIPLLPPIDFRGLLEQSGLTVVYQGDDSINNWRGKGQVSALIAQK
jgi:SAM-dependent methyltransferase